MFPNIDLNLGITAVSKALNKRACLVPSTKLSVVEAVEICLTSNNSHFGASHFIQAHGTAMGPKKCL